MHAINRLRLDRKRPPRVHHVHPLGTGQVESDTARFEGQKQHAELVARLKLGEHRRARLLGHGPVQPEKSNLVAGEGGGDQSEEGRELGDDEGLHLGMLLPESAKVGD